MEIISVSQFINYMETNGFLNGRYVFRGHSNKKFELNPSINRNDSLCFERKYIETPQLFFPERFNSTLSPINQLALLQHYGFPTRLLDVTSSPLVALYFAVRNKENDAEIIVFNKLNEHSLDAEELNVLAKSYKMDFSVNSYDIDTFFNEQGLPEKPTVNFHSTNYERIYNTIHKPFYITASYMTTRQKSQNGSFFFFPNDIKDGRFLFQISPIDKNDKEIVIDQIIIEEKYKDTIQNELDILGINYSTMFPEDFDSSCRKIKTDIDRMNLSIQKQNI